eukprot:CAMPEP_0184732322 /NCGR_PEP_ID=MMETSP0314-20130426/53883_1 /TAXON_ID=38298 /ORGANISM="Rhodella maculata, Strain CCMP 736" /LENGTH=105 /DNA_ID=CAMNT_0027198885 /DNA_START=31 /DNA_END=345 /DNA_ORIENTATION=-
MKIKISSPRLLSFERALSDQPSIIPVFHPRRRKSTDVSAFDAAPPPRKPASAPNLPRPSSPATNPAAADTHPLADPHPDFSLTEQPDPTLWVVTNNGIRTELRNI